MTKPITFQAALASADPKFNALRLATEAYNMATPGYYPEYDALRVAFTTELRRLEAAGEIVATHS